MKLLSSIDGLITQLAFATNEPTVTALSSYKGILETFPAEISIVMLVKPDAPVPKAAQDRLQAHWIRLLARSGRAKHKNPLLIFASDSQPIRRWIQDPFAVLVDPATGARCLLSSRSSPQGDRYGRTFAQALNLTAATAKAYFEGGNLLFVSDVLLLGKDTLRRPSNSAKAGRTVQKQLQTAFGAPACLLLGGSIPRQMMPREDKCYQPFFHLDLYLSPAGQDIHGRPTMLLAELSDDFIYASGRPPRWEEMRTNIATALEETRLQLVEAGFVVARIPIVLHVTASGYTVYSFNNMKVEVDGHIRRAYLPSYSAHTTIPALKDMLEQGQVVSTQKLAACGFEVRPVQARLLALTSSARGSLHCIAKTLQRHLSAPPAPTAVNDVPASTL